MIGSPVPIVWRWLWIDQRDFVESYLFDAFEVLAEVAKQMRAGNAISVVPYAMMLSTQEAAEMLGISRPTLIRLLEQREIPYDKPNRHRRVKLADVLEHRELTHRAAVGGDRLGRCTHRLPVPILCSVRSPRASATRIR